MALLLVARRQARPIVTVAGTYVTLSLLSIALPMPGGVRYSITYWREDSMIEAGLKTCVGVVGISIIVTLVLRMFHKGLSSQGR